MKPLTVEGTQLYTVYKVDTKNKITSKVNIKTKDVQTFTSKVFIQELKAPNKRSFRFASETTELANIVKSIIVNSDKSNFSSIFESNVHQLAKRLLRAQEKSAANHPGINPPKEGSLVVIYLKKEDKFDILISKIDQAIILDLEDSLYKSGLPEEHATQKSCSISYELVGDEYQQTKIEVSDSSPKIATFWVEDFLELDELNTNESNTRNAFNAIDNVLSQYVKKKSKRDYEELRNNLVGYFQRKGSFKFDDMIENVIGEYCPDNEKIVIDDLKNRLNELPKKKDFDTSFNIIVSEIKARFKRSYKVSDKIELRTSDYIEDLKNVILAKEDEYGERVLVIKNIDDKLYDTFKIDEEWF